MELPHHRKSRLRAIVSGSVGNLVEWYDWYAYTAFSLYFAPVFFPGKDATAELLNTAGVFAVGFLMRPIGGWLFGSLADRKGRKFAMTLSVLLMSFGSLVIALTPSYNSIGIAAPVLLLTARLLQGLSVGGEYGTAATYLSEMAGTGRRGFYSSFQYVTLIGGQLIAVGIQLLLQNILSTAEMQNWGWRIPFFIGAVLSLIAFYLRRTMEETQAFEQEKKADKLKRGSLKELFQHPRAIATVVGLTLGGTIAFYTYTTYMQKFLVNTVHLTKAQSTQLSFVSLLIYAALQPLFGLLSDRIGRRPLLIGFGILGTVCTVPILTTLSTTTDLFAVFLLMMCALVIVSGYTSINAVVKAELFPAKIRALGVGFPYSVTVALFGGTAEYLALWFKGKGNETGYYWYTSGCVFISLLVYVFMKETKKTSLLERGA
ncbi:MFS transporter [Sediminibacterium roseum]|uniref:MFS transporter n=2 Tax=Sediminibacterium roseum TaxID=1978412 RepID=A0ABW9ZQ56_9BACT|nr:MFS transporter [Sediminibacterium roseum]